jgi:cell division septal protein FtsQ
VLTTVPAITDAQADCRRYPAGCLITIKEREAVFAWVTDGQTYWIDPEGVLFKAWEDRELPTLRGPLPDSEQVSPRIWEGMQGLITLGVPAETLTYDPTYGLIWTDPAGRRVLFGVGAAMPARWQVYQALSEDLAARDITVRTIDVRFPGGPTYVTE